MIKKVAHVTGDKEPLIRRWSNRKETRDREVEVRRDREVKNSKKE